MHYIKDVPANDFFTFGTFGIFTGTYTIVRETITGSK